MTFQRSAPRAGIQLEVWLEVFHNGWVLRNLRRRKKCLQPDLSTNHPVCSAMFLPVILSPLCGLEPTTAWSGVRATSPRLHDPVQQMEQNPLLHICICANLETCMLKRTFYLFYPKILYILSLPQNKFI